MKKLKFLFILLIPLIITLNISNKTSAYTFFSNFNITKFSYKVDSTSGTIQTVNSINNNASTPYVTDSFTGNYHAIISPKFTLNKSGAFSKTKRMLIQFEVMTKYSKADGTSNVNTYFICPMGEGNLRIARCVIHNSDYEVIGEYTEKDNPSQGTDNTYALVSDKSYIVELELYYNSDTDVSLNELQLAGRIFAVSVNPNSSPLPTGFYWQMSWIQSSAFLYEDPNAAANAINEQNRKDDQDRSNINDQQEENDSEASDQEEEANQTGQTLMGAFSSLITALGNVHTTNCKLPNMSVYSIQLKNMDLCTVNMPSGVSALAGIAMSLIIIKMGYSLVKRMLNLYKEIIG